MFVGGWVPYWRSDAVAASIKAQWDQLDLISPFSLEVDKHGHLKNPFRARRKLWQEIQDRSQQKNNRKLYVPTIFWTKTYDMHEVFSHKAKRDEHARQIIDMVISHNFDGININYEKVSGQDRENYLLFLKKLSEELHRKGRVLYVTLGGRTGDNTIGVLSAHDYAPKHEKKHHHRHHVKKHQLDKLPTSLNPGSGEAAVRYKKVLRECCDLFFVMGYDEWGKPYKRSKEYLKNNYFVSHASNQWVEQIIQYVLTFVPPHKVVLGVPSYGLEFALIKKDGDIQTKKRRNVKYYDALKLAQTHNVKPTRTAGGELSFVYTNHAHEKRYVCFLDSQSIKDKINLVKKYRLKGICLFTLDGDVDKNIWPALRAA